MIQVNGIKIVQNHFPDGTLLIKHFFEDDLEEFTILWKYESDAELFTLYCIVQHLRRIFEKTEISLVMPYIPHARMDRVKNEEDVFTLKYFCEIINSMEFKQVDVLDPHSAVSEALINNIVIDTPEEEINKAINKCNPDILFYPDEGAMKRYAALAPMEYAFGVKKRDWSSGEILGLDIIGSNVAGKNILIIDDICSRGGTFYHAAKKLKEAGAADIYLYITHCEDTIYEGELLKEDSLIKRIYTTDSLLTKTHDSRIEVITSYYA